MSWINYLFVVNPISGGNDKTGFYKFIEEENKTHTFSFEFYMTSGENDLSKIKALIKKSNPKIIVA